MKGRCTPNPNPTYIFQMTSFVHGAVGARSAPVSTDFQFGPWSVKAVRSHILESEGNSRER